MPCRDFRDDQTYSAGYQKAKEERKKEILAFNSKLLEVQKQLMLVESFLCTVIRQSAKNSSIAPESVINQFIKECPKQLEGIRDWWTKHSEKDAERLKKHLVDMDKFDKIQLLELLKEELDDN